MDSSHVVILVYVGVVAGCFTAVHAGADEYNMKHKYRGACIIINNFKFDPLTYLEDRVGTHADNEVLRRKFRELDFGVTTHDDVSLTQLLDILLKASRKDHSDNDAFVLIFLTHGDDGGIWMTDAMIDIPTVMYAFNAVNCPTLAGKPKIIYVQACRGSNLDKGVSHGSWWRRIWPRGGPRKRRSLTDPSQDTPVTMDSEHPIHLPSHHNTSIPSHQGKLKPRQEKRSSREAHPHRRGKRLPNGVDLRPEESDFLVAYSSTDGYSSWRGQETGTWFIQSLMKVLTKYGTRMDLLTMMTRVNRRVAYRYESMSKEKEKDRSKQMPQLESTLTKDVYFRPKEKDRSKQMPQLESTLTKDVYFRPKPVNRLI